MKYALFSLVAWLVLGPSPVFAEESTYHDRQSLSRAYAYRSAADFMVRFNQSGLDRYIVDISVDPEDNSHLTVRFQDNIKTSVYLTDSTGHLLDYLVGPNVIGLIDMPVARNLLTFQLSSTERRWVFGDRNDRSKLVIGELYQEPRGQ